MTSYNDKICGIYAIVNTKNNKIYVGQSRDIVCRWRMHKHELNTNTHYNSHLQRSWNSYGGDSFDFIILELCNTSQLNEREMFYINKYNTTKYDCGYNMCGGGDGIYSVSDETRLKISQARKGNSNWTDDSHNLVSGKNHWSRRNPERLFELTGYYPTMVYCVEYDMYFDSVNAAAKSLNINKSNISKVIKGQRKTAGKHKNTGAPLHWIATDWQSSNDLYYEILEAAI
jgi:hypothetical protein